MKPSEQSTRRYVIQDNEYSFRTGIVGNRQLLVGLLPFTHTVAVWFDASGAFQQVETIESMHEGNMHEPSATACFEALAAAVLRERLEAWLQRVEFQARTIVVQSFFLEDLYIGIMALPTCYSDFLGNPELIPDPEEREEVHGYVREWIDSGNYVLCWGRDHWMNREGEVIAT